MWVLLKQNDDDDDDGNSGLYYDDQNYEDEDVAMMKMRRTRAVVMIWIKYAPKMEAMQGKDKVAMLACSNLFERLPIGSSVSQTGCWKCDHFTWIFSPRFPLQSKTTSSLRKRNM